MPVQTFPQTWNADILPHGRGRWLILASEESSLFTLLIPAGRDRLMDSFLIPFRERMVQLLESIRWGQPPGIPEIRFSSRTNRSVIGSQNDLVSLARHCLKDTKGPASPDTLHKIEQFLNSTPMSYLDMDSPAQALAKQTSKLKGGRH